MTVSDSSSHSTVALPLLIVPVVMCFSYFPRFCHFHYFLLPTKTSEFTLYCLYIKLDDIIYRSLICMEMNNKVNEDFLPELKYAFEQDLLWKSSLDNKATTMITMASAITTFLIAIATFLFSNKINLDYSILSVIIPMLLVAIVFAIIAISFFIRSYVIKDYRFPVGHEAFFDKDEYKNEVVQIFLSYSKNEFDEHMIEEYLRSMKKNSENNKSKSNSIKTGQYCYLGAISSIVSILGFVIIATVFNIWPK